MQVMLHEVGEWTDVKVCQRRDLGTRTPHSRCDVGGAWRRNATFKVLIGRVRRELRPPEQVRKVGVRLGQSAPFPVDNARAVDDDVMRVKVAVARARSELRGQRIEAGFAGRE
jgi:hypothetical protein